MQRKRSQFSRTKEEHGYLQWINGPLEHIAEWMEMALQIHHYEISRDQYKQKILKASDHVQKQKCLPIFINNLMHKN